MPLHGQFNLRWALPLSSPSSRNWKSAMILEISSLKQHQWALGWHYIVSSAVHRSLPTACWYITSVDTSKDHSLLSNCLDYQVHTSLSDFNLKVKSPTITNCHNQWSRLSIHCIFTPCNNMVLLRQDYHSNWNKRFFQGTLPLERNHPHWNRFKEVQDIIEGWANTQTP